MVALQIEQEGKPGHWFSTQYFYRQRKGNSAYYTFPNNYRRPI
jgi:hypothetical protein